MSFFIGNSYTRQQVYEIVSVPHEKRRGNWETGYNQYNGDLFIFCNVGDVGRSGHDYDNRWLEEGRFQWFAKERTHIGQKQIQWMLDPKGEIFLFTRKDNREPFSFEGYCEPVDHDDSTPVRIVWRVHPSPRFGAPINFVLAHREEISQDNYVRRADPSSNYWFGFDRSRVAEYREKSGDDFHLVLVGDPSVAGDFYSIPYQAMSHMLVADYATTHKDGRVRWIGDVRHHRLRISHCPTRLDVGQYYGAPISDAVRDDEVENEYAIENRLAEVEQRQKQSVFRKRVLSNFDERCCVSGIPETDLLVASHIVPWSESVDSRLDPSNGLCLFVAYDALFDKGYFTLSDNLEIIVTTKTPSLSPPLASILAEVNGKCIRRPVNVPIGSDFLSFHRKNIFIP